MKQTKKTIILVSSLIILVLALSVGLTMAYLQDTTATVENTFTVGKVDITLTEPGFDEMSAESKIMVPGREIMKDPIITVMANSEDAYIRAAVVIPPALAGSIEMPLTLNPGWSLGGDGYYYYSGIVPKSGTDTVLPAIFSSFTVRSDATNASLAALTPDDLEIDVTAYAIQAEGFVTPAAAWAAFA